MNLSNQDTNDNPHSLKQEVVSIFVDAANIGKTVQNSTPSYHIDFIKLYKFFEERYVIENAYYFHAYQQTAQAIEKYNKFKRVLIHNNYQIRDKPQQEIFGTPKGNIDLELTMEVMLTYMFWDRAILCSGDGDFKPLVDFLHHHSKRVTVVSEKGTLSSDLQNVADNVIFLSNIKEKISLIQTKGS